MKLLITILSITMHVNVIASQLPTSVVNGVKDDRHTIHAFTHAHIFVDSKTELNDATMIVKDNEIINIGEKISIPADAITHDLDGAYIYPGFVLLDSDYGLSKVPKKSPFSFFGKEILDSTTKGVVNSNEAIKASYQAVADFHHDKEAAKTLRKIGFSTVLSSKHDGIMRGTSVLVSLNDKADQQSIVQAEPSFHLSFSKGSSKQLYPISLMGSSALIRQTWLDADWYGQGLPDFADLDLKAVNDNKSRLQFFEVKNWQQLLLADKIALEFDKKIVIKSSGDEYKHIDAIKKLNRSLIVPLSFPKAMDVSDELDAWNVSLDKMMEWEAAPYNLYYLHKNGVEFSIVPKDKKTFLKDLRKAVKKGLPKSAALAALTSIPAKILSNKKLGHLKQGASANFIITQGDIFTDEGKMVENWVAGKRFIINKLAKISSGVYKLELNGTSHELEVVAKDGKLKLKNPDKDSTIKYKAKMDKDFVSIEINDKDNSTQLLGLTTKNAFRNIKGQTPQWSMRRISDIKKNDKEDDKKQKHSNKSADKTPIIAQPFSTYGLHVPATAKSYLINNATVWTNEEDGILSETDVYIKDGKIIKIGKNLNLKAEVTIDGTDLHLTAGIIDEHSHIALLSVNDIAVNSSMVRMEDSLDSDDVDIYRNLAGGVTAAQLLHGSANPIGGQSALIKMRWGATSDELLIKGADNFIKFALGENVKRSSSQKSIRYPLTRMGVEQVYRDAFSNALAYEKQWQTYNKANKEGKRKDKKHLAKPRRDLMLDATLEVINKDRYVSCHSYVQSEINMLMKVADDFDFNINTFTHILEGYKVADKMLKHGAGASTFADWWAYKWEVNYAIPYNASIMTKVGVTTAINSDDAEMARRLNQEAAKSIKYGGMSEQDALKMVTLNPAKLLHLDDRMGSIKVGKDADIVLWSANPMSIYAKANKTFVDGQLLFDRDRQAEIEAQIASERARLIKKINQADEAKMPAMMGHGKHMQCDSITGYEYLLGAVQ
ncbi:MAG: amidohydrolase family protein [Alcanivoracaceae bacterium]|nr:amidohydrolase family protein [Alcanivoracaceae bacterium]